MKHIVPIILLLIVAGLTATAHESSANASESPGKAAATHKVIAYYFHGDARCAGCRRIEAWSADAIRSSFKKELDDGRLEWKVVNVDAAENEHFNDDYKLYTKSLVVVDFRDGRQSRWKNLERIWNYLSDQSEFSKYVSSEVGEYLKEG